MVPETSPFRREESKGAIDITTIYFVRHAEPNFDNHDDCARELTAKGLEDRKLVTAFLRDKRIDLVLSSPYKRAVDTVKDFADAMGYEIGLVEDFRERRVESGWIGDFDAFCRRQWEDFDYKLPGGESLREVQSRNIAALRRVLKEHAGKNIVIGSHGTALSTILHYFDPSFGYDGFARIRRLMPWVVRFAFAGDRCVEIETYDLFAQ
ncbi:MAG: histidine phosphatase family protein [Oscillospiraceae bacterium]